MFLLIYAIVALWNRLIGAIPKKASEYDQEIPQSHTAAVVPHGVGRTSPGTSVQC